MNILKYLNILLVLIYAIGSGVWVSTGDAWYRQLKAPFWQPPDYVFGLIWPYNFTLLAIAGWLVISRLGIRNSFIWLIFFGISIICALTWARLFYVNHNLIGASIALIFTALLTIPLTVLSFRVNWKLGVLFLPYQIWVTIASTLSFGYYKLN